MILFENDASDPSNPSHFLESNIYQGHIFL
jgi:hypothetical protein